MSDPASPAVLHDPWPFHQCPHCGHADFLAEDHIGTLFFKCLGCAATWRYSLGYLVQVVGDDAPEFSQ